MRPILAAAVLLLAACAAAPGTPGTPDAATPLPDCPAGTHAVDSTTCDGALTGWTAGPALAQKRDHHVTFAARTPGGAFVHALGGVVDMATFLASAERAPILADGSLGPWEAEGDLPEAAAGAGIAVSERMVVLVGGFRGRRLSNKAEFARIADDGTLSSWTEGPTMSVTRFHLAAVAHRGFVYAVGGMTGNNTVNTASIERARIDENGLGDWEQVTSLPGPRSHAAVLVHDDALYVVAGLTGNPSGANTVFDDVLRAPLAEDGSVGDFHTAGKLPAPLATHAAFEHAGFLYVVGGIEGDAAHAAGTAHVRRAPLLADGSLGDFEDAPALPGVRGHCHQVPVLGAHVYQVAGAVEHASQATSFVGTLE